MSIIDTALNHVDDAVKIIGYASVVASFTKTKWDNTALNFLAAVVQAFALNFSKAKAATQNKTVVPVTDAQKTVIEAQAPRYNP